MNKIIETARADTDHTILIINNQPIAFIEDEDSDCIGYYQPIESGQYVYNMYSGYSYYLQNSELVDMFGRHPDYEELSVNDGNQRIAYKNGSIDKLLKSLTTGGN